MAFTLAKSTLKNVILWFSWVKSGHL